LIRQRLIATVDELPVYDAIIFGNMCAPMRNFLDRTERLWLNGNLIGKAGSVFTSMKHGGQESMITSFHTSLLRHGMIIVGVHYFCHKIMNMSEITGISAYGASTLAGIIDCSRQPLENEIKIARFQGKLVAEVANKLEKERSATLRDDNTTNWPA